MNQTLHSEIYKGKAKSLADSFGVNDASTAVEAITQIMKPLNETTTYSAITLLACLLDEMDKKLNAKEKS